MERELKDIQGLNDESFGRPGDGLWPQSLDSLEALLQVRNRLYLNLYEQALDKRETDTGG